MTSAMAWLAGGIAGRSGVWPGLLAVQMEAAGGGLWGYLTSPLLWAIAAGGVGLWLMLPYSSPKARLSGAVISLAALGLLAAGLPRLADYASQGVFWILAGVTLISAAATVVMRSAMYAAIWFALSLVGAAGLLLMQEAQFLAVATVVVYAGAIVVTFLFVIMLAQPQGQAPYDRITWGRFPKPFSVLAAAALVAALTFALAGLREGGLREQVSAALSQFVDDQQNRLVRDDQVARAAVEFAERRTILRLTLRSDVELERIPRDELERLLAERLVQTQIVQVEPDQFELQIVLLERHQDLLHENHTSHLGGQLFSRHLISVEAAGVLLLAALVGAVAIAIQGRQRRELRGGRSYE